MTDTPNENDVPATDETPADTEHTEHTADTEDRWGDDFDAAKAKDFITKLRRSERDKQKQIDRLKPLADEAESLRRDKLTEIERATADAERATAEATTLRTRVATAEATAIAAQMKFVDAAVGVRLLGDLSGFVNGDDIDTEQIRGALDELLADHPYLGRQDDEPKRMKPNPAQGLNADVPSADHGVRDAEQRGDYRTSAHLKAEQLLALRQTQ